MVHFPLEVGSFWVKVHFTKPTFLWAMHEFLDRSCIFFFQIRLIQANKPLSFPFRVFSPLPGFHLAPMLPVWEQHLNLKGLFPFKHLDFAETMRGSATISQPTLCGSLFETPACVHLTHGCCNWLVDVVTRVVCKELKVLTVWRTMFVVFLLYLKSVEYSLTLLCMEYRDFRSSSPHKEVINRSLCP